MLWEWFTASYRHIYSNNTFILYATHVEYCFTVESRLRPFTNLLWPFVVFLDVKVKLSQKRNGFSVQEVFGCQVCAHFRRRVEFEYSFLLLCIVRWVVYDGDSVKHTLTHMGALLCAPHFKAKKTVFSLYDIFCGIVNFHRSVTASGVEARGRATDSCAARASQTN